MRTLFLTGSVAFIISFFALPAIIKIADAKRLFDIPDSRKIHRKPIASLGGVGMFVGFILADLLLISNNLLPQLQYFLAATIITFFLGLKDDILIITPVKKILGELLAAAIVIHLGGLRIDSLHGIWGVHQIPEALSYPLTYCTVILVINAYNLIDGIDGLAGSLGLLTMSVFGLFFYHAGQQAYAMLAFALAGSLLAFLLFNHHPARIFMGDSGSLALGLFNAILVLKFLEVADAPGAIYHLESAAPIAIALLSVPLVDTLRVFGIRVYQGRSPFSPDRNHIHHLMLSRGMGHKNVTLCCVGINSALLVFAYLCRGMGATFVLATLTGIVLSLLAFLIYYPGRLRQPPLSMPASAEGEPASRTKVVRLITKAAASGN